MVFKKILYATDFSDASKAALPLASALARASDAVLLIVHVEEVLPEYHTADQYFHVPPEYVNHQVEKMLRALAPTDDGVRHDYRHVVGTPAEDIVRLADKEHADLIVLGTHGRTGLSRLLMGSVAEAVVRHAKCPVLTLKVPAAVPAAAH